MVRLRFEHPDRDEWIIRRPTTRLQAWSAWRPIDNQRTGAQELAHRWRDATDGAIKIGTALLDDWSLSLDDLRVAADALDRAGLEVDLDQHASTTPRA